MRECCELMEIFIGNAGGQCIPTIYNGYIRACDETFDEDEDGLPIQFCPWCGEDYGDQVEDDDD